MEQANFQHFDSADPVISEPDNWHFAKHSVRFYSDRTDSCADAIAAVEEAGFALAQLDELAALSRGVGTLSNAVIWLDLSSVSAECICELARLDMELALAPVQLIVSKSMAALDAVFACFDQCSPQILVDASPEEIALAIGMLAINKRRLSLREMGDHERVRLLRIAEQADAVARCINDVCADAGRSAFDMTGASVWAQIDAPEAGLTVGHPFDSEVFQGQFDTELLNQMIRDRQKRSQYFSGSLFADPAWDMLLDLAKAQSEGEEVSVFSLCIASGVPPTTALRWVHQMVDTGLFERRKDPKDKRRVFITLSSDAADAMRDYLNRIRRERVAD